MTRLRRAAQKARTSLRLEERCARWAVDDSRLDALQRLYPALQRVLNEIMRERDRITVLQAELQLRNAATIRRLLT